MLVRRHPDMVLEEGTILRSNRCMTHVANPASLRGGKAMIKRCTFLSADLPIWILNSDRNDTAALLPLIELSVVFEGLVLETELWPTPRIQVTPNKLFASATV